MDIKASDLNLNQLINLSQKSGTKLKDLQLTITSANALGLLQKDLINALGFQRAKRFLLRYGYQCGAHEARIFKEEINWKDNLEWLIAGSKMHQLAGRAFSYPGKFQVDMEKGLFDVSGYWIDSYEAIQHLNNFSENIEPVCNYLVGYASGYTSECLGKKTIFKEIKCKGKGDDYCSYVGKTIDEWGEEISEDLLYYEDEDMSGELDQMYQKVEQQKTRFEVGYSLSRNLMHAMLQGEGLQSFADILGRSLHSSVLIESKDHEILAKFGDNPGMEEYMSAQIIKKERDFLAENVIIETDLQYKTFKLITSAIIIRDQIYGYINIAIDQNTDVFNKDLLERATTISALYIQNERVAIETEHKLKGELLDQLLNDKQINVKEIHNRFSYLGYNLNEPHYVLYIEIDNNDTEKSKSIDLDNLKVRNKLTNLIYKRAKNFSSQSLILTKLNTLQVIISKEYFDSQQISVKTFAEQLLKKSGKDEEKIYIGVSSETKTLSDFRKKSEEAKKAVELAKVRSSTPRVILSNELGHLRVFLNARSPEELEQFANEKLNSILTYDKKKNSELLLTLFYYSQNEFNLHKTARKMSVSVSGMRYRIQKIEKLLDLDLSTSNNRFEIQLCLQIQLMLGGINL